MIRDISARAAVTPGTEYDPQIARLPHPQRFIATMARLMESVGWPPNRPFYEMIMGKPAYDEMVAELERCPMNWKVAHNLATRREEFNELFKEMMESRGSTHGGNVYWLLNFTRWNHSGKRFFQTTDALDEMLLHSDIGKEIPLGLLRTPFPMQYIQFGESMRSPLRVWNAATGLHVAEGCYVMSGVMPEGIGFIPERPETGGQRFIEFLFSGSALGKAHNLDDATQAITLPIPDEEDTLVDVIEATLADEAGLGRPKTEAEAEALRATLYHAGKILLYLNSEAVQKTEFKEASELAVRLARVGAGKRGKLQRQLSRAYDRIVIGPKTGAPPPSHAEHADTGRTVRPHWRRGFFKSQHYGEKRALRKPVWIAPTLVRAEAAVTAPESKTYVIKER